MLQGKKWLIAAVVLFLLSFALGFGLSIITEAFLVIAIYCGISAMFCLIVGLRLESGDNPPFIWIGLGMAFFGLILLKGCDDFYRELTVLASGLYAIAGGCVFVKGILDWRTGSRSRQKRHAESGKTSDWERFFAAHPEAVCPDEKNLQQISYALTGIRGQTVYSCISAVTDRLIAEGFIFCKADVSGKDAISLSVLSDHAIYTDYSAFKNNFFEDMQQRQWQIMEQTAGWIDHLDSSCISGYLALNTLKVYVKAEKGSLMLHWIDTSDRAFDTVYAFVKKLNADIFYNTCAVKQTEPAKLTDGFLSNWQ